MRRKWYGRDTELSVRMFLTMFLLAALYLGFLVVLWRSGVGFVTLALIAGVMLGVQYFFSDKLVLLSMGAKVLKPNERPELQAMVERLAALADLPRPRVAIVDHSMPNAFATGRNPQNAVVAVTTGILNKLDRAELEAVLAHELTHIKNRDAMVLTLASFLSSIAFFVLRSSIVLGYGYGGGYGRRRGREGQAAVFVYLAALAVWVISFFLIRALSRYREFAADRGGAIITGAPSQLSSALLKISGAMQRIPQRDLREVETMNAFFIVPALSRSSILELFSTHPSVEKRIARLQRMEQQMEER